LPVFGKGELGVEEELDLAAGYDRKMEKIA
jgi:hypothetical protein